MRRLNCLGSLLRMEELSTGCSRKPENVGAKQRQDEVLPLAYVKVNAGHMQTLGEIWEEICHQAAK